MSFRSSKYVRAMASDVAGALPTCEMRSMASRMLYAYDVSSVRTPCQSCFFTCAGTLSTRLADFASTFCQKEISVLSPDTLLYAAAAPLPYAEYGEYMGSSRPSRITNGELVSGPPMPKKLYLGPAPATANAGRLPASVDATAAADSTLAMCLLALICKLRAPKRPAGPKAATTARTAKATTKRNMVTVHGQMKRSRGRKEVISSEFCCKIGARRCPYGWDFCNHLTQRVAPAKGDFVTNESMTPNAPYLDFCSWRILRSTAVRWARTPGEL